MVVGAGLSGDDARGFGNPNNIGATCMGVLNSRIYAGTWNNNGCEVRFDRFSTTWYLAEGATAGGFDTYVLVQNPNNHAVDVDIKFQTREGEKQGPGTPSRYLAADLYGGRRPRRADLRRLHQGHRER